MRLRVRAKLRTTTAQRRRPDPFFSDVEHLATVAADTANRLNARGLPELARPLPSKRSSGSGAAARSFQGAAPADACGSRPGRA
jgi:hypothetical protein